VLRGSLNRLGVQIALTATAVIVLVGLGVLYQVDQHLHRNEEQRHREQVGRARLQIEEQLLTYTDLAVTGAIVLAGQSEMQDAIASLDLARALGISTRFFAQTGAPLQGQPGLQIYDADGGLLIRAHAPLNARQEAIPPEVARVLRTGQSHASLRYDELLGLSISGIAPVYSPEGRLAGAIEGLTGLDGRFVRDQARLLGVEVAVIDRDGVVASTEGYDAPDTAALIAEADAMPRGAVFYSGPPEDRYLSSTLVVRDSAGAPIGLVYVGIDESAITAAIAGAREGVIRAVGLGVVASVLASAIFSFVALRPIGQLVAAARRIQANDLERPVDVRGSGEVRALAGALEEMRDALQQGREAMLSANRDLALRFDASSATLSEVTQELAVMQGVLAELAGEAPGGLPSAVEEITHLDWVDGAVIALANEEGHLSPAASAGTTPGAATLIVEALEQGLDGQRLESGVYVSDARTGEPTRRLAAWGISGLAAQPMLTPDGVAGVLVVTSARPMTLTGRRRELLRSVAREVAATLERSELADEVEENRRIAEAVLREMSDGVLVIDYSGVCRICNPAAARMLRRNRAEIVGHVPEAYLPLSDDAIQALRRRASRTDLGPTAPLLAEVDGRKLAISAGPFADPDPERSGMLILIRDLSAEAEAERVKQDFVSMVGHELRTPLTLIRTTIDLLHEGDAGVLNETQERVVEVLRNNADRLMALISDLLDMSALDSGRMQIVPSSIDLGEVVTAAVEAAQPAAAVKRHELTVTAPAGLIVYADRRRIEQVLSNLIGNAIKYTPPGGRIDVEAYEEQPFARVSVRDNGIGIPPEEQAHLFEKFYRTAEGRRTTGGTGLGLAIARSIIELHGGAISCESDGRDGSTFTFTLPRRRI
jgi:signal transduction histidine kinase